MKITQVSPQKSNNLRVNVFVDGVYSFSLDAADAALKGIKPGKELSEKNIKNLVMDSEFTKARDAALGILSRKAISSKALGDKLLEKGYNSLVVAEAINELSDLGYIDDENYALMFLEYCLEKMWGKKKIRYEMKIKGLDDEIIEDVLSSYEDDSQIEAMVELIKTKYSGLDLSDVKNKAKIIRFFASRGFDFSKIDIAIREISNE